MAKNSKEEKIEKVKTLRRLARQFGKEDHFDEELIDIFLDALEDMSADTFKSVAKWLAKRNRFMPSVAEMYEAVKLMEEEWKDSREYKAMVNKVVQWLEDNREFDYATGLCLQEDVEEALVALGMEKGSVDARDI